jgi:hypothetical protein
MQRNPFKVSREEMRIQMNPKKQSISETLGELSALWAKEEEEKRRNPPKPRYRFLGEIARGTTAIVYHTQWLEGK